MARYQRRPLVVAAFGTLTICGQTCTGVVTAQSTDAAPRDEAVEEIVVTGSRIPRRDFTTPSPLTTVDSLELRLSGTTNLEDALDALPQVIPGYNRTANDPVGRRHDATVNLRGLGESRTLVLVDGRRFISSATDGVVDINNIPAALIDRTELVTGGASAVYGSDALAGAVNFILKDSFEGIEVHAQYDVTDRDDGQIIDVSVTGGLSIAGGRGHLSGYIGYNDRNPITQAARSHSAQTRDEDFFTGETFIGGSLRNPEGMIPNPVDIGGIPAPDGITFNQDGTPRPFDLSTDLYDFGPPNYIQRPLTRTSAAGFFSYEGATSTEIYSELWYVDNSTGSQLAPTLNPGSVEMNIDNPFLTPETRQILIDFLDPDGDGIAQFVFNKRLVELGPRIISRDSEMIRAIVGATGEFGNGWTWDIHYLWSDVDAVESFDNNASQSNIRQALLVNPVTGQCIDPSNGCAPANFFGAGNLSPEAADFIRVPAVVQETGNQQSLVNANVVGDFPSVFQNPVQFAIGLEYRSEEISFVPDPALTTGNIAGVFPSPPVEGKFTIRELFGELLVPIVSGRLLAKDLSVEAGYRFTDHSISGQFDTWKFSAQWEPVDGLKFRASAQEAVRAPNGIELFEGAFTGEFPFFHQIDLCSASLDPDALGVTDVCIAQGIPANQIGVYEATPFFLAETLTGGNLNLDPEISDTLTAGVVFQPAWAPELEMSLDYYSIRIDNAIQDISPGDTVIHCFTINDSSHELCQAIERTDPSFNITRVSAGPRNIAKIQTEGFDLQISYSIDLADVLSMFDEGSELHLRFFGNHTLKNGTQTSPSAPFFECAGLFSFPCNTNSFGSLPEYKTNTRLTYTSGPLSLSLRWLWIDSMDSAFLEYGLGLLGLQPADVMLNVPKVSSEQYFALSFDYEINDSIEIYGGIRNLLDNDPPWLGFFFVQANTDPSIYDVYGRRYFIGINAQLGQ